jgi:hypothetical protein
MKQNARRMQQMIHLLGVIPPRGWEEWAWLG